MLKKFLVSIIMCSILLCCIGKYYCAETEITVWNPVQNEIIPSNTIKTNSEAQKQENVSILQETPSTVSNNPLNLTCGGAILIEQNSGNILYNHNMHEKLRPASVTKVMTILLIMEALDRGEISLNDNVPCTEDAAQMGGS